eukprot:CAMPEP_0182816290 /NCGR_PEP_ID=MMETSP0006_2-20121128/10856_1 /TAXON_ID=97485 /ORGANISM="Prymnesium parvum, Strain Texoma1" /LENGTH=110 /DNA_ID=CAMNT_0024942567 /DNA_START=245 /DNA_END=578 /DNA_ORIENTATION=-
MSSEDTHSMKAYESQSCCTSSSSAIEPSATSSTAQDKSRLLRLRHGLPANVTTNDDIVVVDAHVLVDQIWDNRCSHGELNWGRVHNADDIARSDGLQEAQERPVEAILRV